MLRKLEEGSRIVGLSPGFVLRERERENESHKVECGDSCLGFQNQSWDRKISSRPTWATGSSNFPGSKILNQNILRTECYSVGKNKPHDLNLTPGSHMRADSHKLSTP